MGSAPAPIREPSASPPARESALRAQHVRGRRGKLRWMQRMQEAGPGPGGVDVGPRAAPAAWGPHTWAERRPHGTAETPWASASSPGSRENCAAAAQEGRVAEHTSSLLSLRCHGEVWRSAGALLTAADFGDTASLVTGKPTSLQPSLRPWALGESTSNRRNRHWGPDSWAHTAA